MPVCPPSVRQIVAAREAKGWSREKLALRASVPLQWVKVLEEDCVVDTIQGPDENGKWCCRSPEAHEVDKLPKYRDKNKVLRICQALQGVPVSRPAERDAKERPE
jgi:hypothetical protein